MRPVRYVLSCAVLVLAVGCSSSQVPPSGQGGGDPSPGAAEPVASVEGQVRGARVRLDVDSLTREADLTRLRARLTVLEGVLEPRDQFSARDGSDPSTLSDVRLVVPEQDLLASPARDARGAPVTTRLGRVELGADESIGTEVVFGALPDDTRAVDVLWPLLGVLPDVPVTDDEPAPLAPYGGREPRPAAQEPVEAAVLPLKGRGEQLDGAVRTEQDEDETRILIGADVIFAFDSDQLEPAAREALDRAADEVRATGEGPVRVVGHTDDVGDDAYNDDLSRRRAATVAEALAPLLPPDRFPPTVEGRGEREPAVEGAGEEARNANRRVELVVERGQDGPRSTGDAPPSAGPEAAADEGLLLPVVGGDVRLTGERAVRTGGWLRIELAATLEEAPSGRAPLTVDLRSLGSPELNSASGVGLVDGVVVLLPGMTEDGTCACTSVPSGVDLEEGETRRIAVWVLPPSDLGDEVSVELPQGQGRLTGVPVQDGSAD